MSGPLLSLSNTGGCRVIKRRSSQSNCHFRGFHSAFLRIPLFAAALVAAFCRFEWRAYRACAACNES